MAWIAPGDATGGVGGYGPVAPLWGWKRPGGGRAAHVTAGVEYQGTTVQVCGLYPYTAGSGSPLLGVPIGRHMLWGETVCLDPIAWLRAGLVTNPGVFLLGQPGTGKSALAHRLITGMVATGTRALVLGDTKPDYTPHITALDGQVITVGRGRDRINPLDAGPLGQALARMSGAEAAALRWEVRGRRLALLLALATLVRGAAVSNAEEVILGRAMDLLGERPGPTPTVPDVLALLAEGPDELRAAARAENPADYTARVDGLLFTLSLLCEGSLAGVFDGPTSTPIDLDAPAVSIDISHVGVAGDTLLAAALLCVWSYGFGMIDASATLAQAGLGPRRTHLAVMDELWRALRGPGLVAYADALTRLNRALGMGSLMITHSLADLDALTSAEDRAQAQGFIDRAAITIAAGLPPRELDRLDQITPMTSGERDMVASWSAPESWQPGTRHPGRGKYLLKTAGRLGIPVQMTLVGAEYDLYDSDQAIRAAR